MAARWAKRKSGGGFELADFLVENAKDTVGDGEVPTVQGQFTACDLVRDIGEGHEVREADFNRLEFHRQLRLAAIGAKLVIIFHVTAYGLIRFALDDVITLHFIHLYAVLFAAEIAIMLVCSWIWPRSAPASDHTVKAKVDLTPWKGAVPTAILLLSAVAACYLLFSPVGLAGGQLGAVFWTAIAALAAINIAAAIWHRGVSGGGLSGNGAAREN